MTLIVRRIDAPVTRRLGRCGVCRVGLCEIVGMFGRGPLLRVVFLGGS